MWIENNPQNKYRYDSEDNETLPGTHDQAPPPRVQWVVGAGPARDNLTYKNREIQQARCLGSIRS